MMTDIRCPQCSKMNPEGLSVCKFCGTQLKALPDETIHPGEEPTKKSTSELEKALPDWLRQLRHGNESEKGESDQPASSGELDKEPPAEDDFLSRLSAASSESKVTQEPPAIPQDLLAGLSASTEEDDEVPGWLASIQSQVQQEVQAAQPVETPPTGDSGDWLTRLNEEEKPKPRQEEPSEWYGFRGEPVAPLDFGQEDEAQPVKKEAEDWFTAPASEEKSTGQSSLQSNGGMPDWLADLEASQKPSIETVSPKPVSIQPPASEDLPDWLCDLQASEQAAPAASETGAPIQPEAIDAESPDWLSQLDAESGQAPAAIKSASPIQPPSFETGMPDWLDQLDASEKNESQPFAGQVASLSSDAGTADWLSQLEAETDQPIVGDQAAPVQTPVFGTEMPDWLNQLESETSQPVVGEQAIPQQPVFDGEMPDWLSQLESETTKPSVGERAEPVQPVVAADADTPDWLSKLESETAKPVEKPAPPLPVSGQPAAPKTGLTSWLRTFDSLPPAVEQPTSTDERADLLRKIDISSSQPSDVQTPPAAIPEIPLQASEVPDWLSAFGAGQIAAPASPSLSVPASPPAQGVPDWLAGLQSSSIESASENQPESIESLPVKPVEDLPDWLAGMATVGAGVAASSVEEPSTLDNLPLANEPFSSEIPDWLAGGAIADKDIVESTTPTTPAFVQETSAEGSELLGMEMPDWLSDMQPSGADASVSAAKPVDQASIAPTELPSWVQAMRPVEAVVPETDNVEEQLVESQGPLAGIRNVLPMTAGLISIKRPVSFSSKLQVNENQQNNAALLESLLNPEAETSAVRTGQRPATMRILRWAIALFLFIFVAIPIVLGSKVTPTSNLYPPELITTVKTVNALPKNSRVLVVFDYEPAFAGEVSVAASPLLDHLMLKGAQLTFVSSIPTGSTQGQYLLDTALKVHGYVSGEQYVNLGYIPGGAAGIYNFANDPTIVGINGEGNSVWEQTPFLSGVNSLDDFDAMVVLTDSSDVGRVWIEQSRVPLKDKPLLMAISAQAEPMLRPYYDSVQIQGMVTGLAGGTYYEQINGRPAFGREYWDAFSVAFLIAEIIIVVGGIWALFAAWRARRAQTENGA
jgi:hypothetical protein